MHRVPGNCFRCIRLVLSALVLLSAGSASGCSSEPPNPLEEIRGIKSIYANMGRERVVRVFGTKSVGKGVVLGDGSWILTGAHLLKGLEVGSETSARLRVENADLRGGDARPVAVDPGRGLALLKLDRQRFEAAKLRTQGIPVSGDQIYLIVEDDLIGLAPADGRISGRREYAPGDLLRLSGSVAPEEYGGPVFEYPSGLVVGLVIPDALVEAKVQASYAQAVPALLDFLRAAGGPTQ